MVTVTLMPRSLMAAFIALQLLAAPVLCLAGVLEHLCSDCAQTFSCGHEDDCEQDPCSEIAVRPASSTRGDLAPAVAILPVPPCVAAFVWSAIAAPHPIPADLAGPPSLR
ncbi:MAG: hypothetical protein ACRDGR_11075, partial [bacterium]